MFPFIEKGDTVVCFGDSITAADPGYVSALQEALPDNKIINAGRPGDKTPWALTRFMQDVVEKKPDALLIYFGANDAAIGHGRWADEPAVSAEAYRCNLLWMTHLAKLNNIHKISIAAPLGFEGDAVKEYGNCTAPYQHAARMAANESRSRIVPLDIFFENGRAEQPGNTGLILTADGVHPTAETYKKIAGVILEAWKVQ